MVNECEALPGVAYPGVRDNRSTLNTKTGYDDDESLIATVILTRGQSNLTKSASWGAHSPVRGHPRGRKLYH